MPIVPVTDATFETEVLLSDLPVLVDFSAEWCAPCKALAPTLEKLADDYAGALKIVKVDVDQNPASVQAFRVQSVPTLALVHERKVVDMVQGAVDRATLEQLIGQVASRSGVETWDVERTALALEAQVATAVDLREEADFRRARLPGAINIPLAQFGDRANELAGLGALVLYDRTGSGVMDTAQAAAVAGLRVAVLDGGLLAWEADIKPVDKG
jgi:thioredoxin